MVFNIVFCWLLFYVMLEFIIKKIQICKCAMEEYNIYGIHIHMKHNNADGTYILDVRCLEELTEFMCEKFLTISSEFVYESY